jgi:hypothetical protein
MTNDKAFQIRRKFVLQSGKPCLKLLVFSATVKDGSKCGWVKRYPNDVSRSFVETGSDNSDTS